MISIVKPWSLAIACIKPMSIPVYLLLLSWKTNGAKEESLAMVYFALTGVAFWPAGVVVSGVELVAFVAPIHFEMILSREPSFFI